MQLLRLMCVIACLFRPQCSALDRKSFLRGPRGLQAIDLSACAGFAVVAGTTSSCGADTPDQCNIFGGELAARTTKTGPFNIFDNTPSSNGKVDCMNAAAAIVSSARTGLNISGAQIGDMTFSPGTHVHELAVSASANSTITLDGQGNSDSVFVFKIGSTFTMGDDCKILLQNGAHQSNVFWILSATLTMGTNSTLIGNVMAGDAAAIADGGMICGDIVVAQTTVSCTGECNIGVDALQCVTGSIPAATYIPSNDQSLVSIASFCNGYTVVARTTTSCGAVAPMEYCNIFSGDVAAGTPMTGAFNVHQAILSDSPTQKTAQMLACANAAALIVAQPRPDGITMPMEIGGMTFSPGTHIHPAAVSVGSPGTANTTVYLDAKGYSDSVFIFRIDSTLTMCDGCKIVLLNGAQPDQVFWIFGTSLIMGANSVMVGTVMAGSTAAIGDGGAICGDIVVAQSTVNCMGDCSIGLESSVCSTVVPLPILATSNQSPEKDAIEYFDLTVSIIPQIGTTSSACTASDLNGIGSAINQLLLDNGISDAVVNDDSLYIAGVCPNPSVVSARRELQMGYVWRGGGACRHCSGDNSDQRKLLLSGVLRNIFDLANQVLPSEWDVFKLVMEPGLAAGITMDIVPNYANCLATNPNIDIGLVGVTVEDFDFVDGCGAPLHR